MPLQNLDPLQVIESEMRQLGFELIAGVDEAGRGPLAGPVVAAACILAEGVFFRGVNDSKLLTPLQRERLFALITTHPDVKYGVGIVDVKMIDKINIHQASLLAMRKALDKLPVKPDYLLVDGFKLKYKRIPCKGIVGGDGAVAAIASASIIAKVTRDRLMETKYHKKYPQYGFNEHKGYGTPKHKAALKVHGPCPIHRQHFAPVKSLLESLTLTEDPASIS